MDIKGTIKAKGYTINQIADQMGINRVTLSRSIAGAPSLTTLRKIAEVIGCNVGDFFADEIQESENATLICPHCGKMIRINAEG